MPEEDSHRNMMSYLRQADETFRNGFESDEIMQIFLRNTFDGIKGSEVSFCMQKSFSFVLEGMLKSANLDIVLDFNESVEDDWFKIASSQAGCHVLQAVFQSIISGLQNLKSRSNEMEVKLQKLKSLFKIDTETLSSLINDTHSTRAFRSYIQMLGGFVFKSDKSKTDNDEDLKLIKQDIPKGYLKVLQQISRCLSQTDKQMFVAYLTDQNAGPSIACLLKVISQRELPKTLRRLCRKIISSCKSESCAQNTLTLLIKDKHASHIIEALLEHGDSDAKKSVRNVLCSDKKEFFDLCAHPVANFVVQKLIFCIHDESEFEDIFEFLSEGLEDIMAGQNYGIVQKICEQCVKFIQFQKKFYDKLLESFHCDSASDRHHIVLLFATLKTHDSLFKGNSGNEQYDIPPITHIEYHGSLLLQTLLKFENVGLIVKSMCEISVENIIILSCDSCGSHFIDAFFTSDKLKFKKRKEIIEKLGGKLMDLACDKYGSRVLENLWNASDIVIKRIIAQNLMTNSAKLTEDAFGKFVMKKFDMKRYESRLEDWEKIQKQKSNKRKLFAGIAVGSKRKK